MTLYIEEKYVRFLSGHVRNFKQKSQGVYNFSCPFCGDSKTDTSKARGYTFKHKGAMIYKCHNCSHSTNIHGLLKAVSPALYSDYMVEEFAESGNKSTSLSNSSDVTDLSDYGNNRSIRLDSCTLPLSAQPDSHVAVQYLLKRRIPRDKINTLYYTDDINSLNKIFDAYDDIVFPKEDRIIIPIKDRFKNLIGISARAIFFSKKRYVILKKGDEPLIYNIENLEYSKTKYVFEGQFDSMFIPNSIAVSGLDMPKTFGMFDNNTVYILDNQPRNKQVIAAMENVIKANKKIFIWPSKIVEKDVNDAISKYPDFLDIINKQTYHGLDATLKLIEWRKI